MTRTSFVTWAVAAVLSHGFFIARTETVDTASASETPWAAGTAETPEIVRTRTTFINRPKEIVIYYKATVPDTLDLAERGRLGINHFTLIQDQNITECPLLYRAIGKRIQEVYTDIP